MSKTRLSEDSRIWGPLPRDSVHDSRRYPTLYKGSRHGRVVHGFIDDRFRSDPFSAIRGNVRVSIFRRLDCSLLTYGA